MDNNREEKEKTKTDVDQMIDAFDKLKGTKTEEELDEDAALDAKLNEIMKHPAFMKEFDPSQPLTEEIEGLMALKYEDEDPPLIEEIEGLIALKYEDEDPIARATSYKEDGNHEFKKKKYKIAIENYTVAITVKCPDKLLNAVLYSNRAAAQIHLGNYRTAYHDCLFARKFVPDHVKAIHKGASCLFEMKKYEECIKWTDDALKIEPTDKIMQDLRNKATKLLKRIERDKRKEEHEERKTLVEDLKLIQTIQGRGIKLAGIIDNIDDSSKISPALLTSIETHNPHGAKVHLDAKNVLYWPVMFLYPEYTETDYIQMFCENHRLIDHLNHMFGVEVDPAPWDKDKKYKPHIINVHFEDKDKEELIKVNKEKTLLKILQHERYIVYGGTPAFILTVAGSEFEKSFLARYGKS